MMVSLQEESPRAVMTVSTRRVLAAWSMCWGNLKVQCEGAMCEGAACEGAACEAAACEAAACEGE